MKENLKNIFFILLITQFLVVVALVFSFLKTTQTGDERRLNAYKKLMNENGCYAYACLDYFKKEEKDIMSKHFIEIDMIPVQYKSFVEWKRLPYSGSTINIIGNGERVHNVGKPDISIFDKSVKKIAIFGGSNIWGFGALDNTSIPAEVEKNSDYKVINLGETGYTSQQILNNIINQLSEYKFLGKQVKFDLVVMYTGINDYFATCIYGTETLRNRMINHAVLFKKTYYQDKFKFLYNLLKTDIAKTFSIRDIAFLNAANNSELREAEKLMVQDNYKCGSEAASKVWKNIKLSKLIVEKMNSKFVAVLEPNPYLKSISEKQKKGLGIEAANHPKWQEYYDELQKLAKKDDYKLEIVSDYVKDLNFIDGLHVYHGQNNKIAEFLIKKIQKELN